jgi:4'-phosphopantetheinyl transferase
MDAGLIARSGSGLGVGQVDIWLTCLCSNCRDPEADALQLLSAAERMKHRRFLAEDARVQYLFSRALVRAVLSRYGQVAEDAWQFETNRYGRPHIAEPRNLSDLRFNLSNTTGLIVCGVSQDCEIGVDVENIGRVVDIDALAPTVFAPNELADFRQCSPWERRDRFFAYWTLKEAYIKARGMGLSLPLDAFWFDLSGRSPLLNVTERCPDDAARWRFYQKFPTADHRLAIAIAAPRGAEPSVRLCWTSPLSGRTDVAPRCYGRSPIAQQ